MQPTRINHTGPTFVTLYPEQPTPRPSQNRAGDPLPVSWFGVRIVAHWNGDPNPIRALVEHFYPSPDSGLCPVGRCAAWGPFHLEFDVRGEHAAFVLSAVMRANPTRLRIDTVSV